MQNILAMQYTIDELSLPIMALKNKEVINSADEKLGEIKDIMLDRESGQVTYIVLSLHIGFLNMGRKYIAIPWEAFYFGAFEDDIIILNVDREKLKNSPGFDKDNWPTTPSFNFINRVHTYYGFDPYYVIL